MAENTERSETDETNEEIHTAELQTHAIEVTIQEQSTTRDYAAPIQRIQEAQLIKSEREMFQWNYKRIQEYLDSQYNSDNTNKSVICDIIAMYLKGQKILYTEAKAICERRMNCLMLPAIFITSVCSILSLVLKDADFGPTIVSSLNGANAFLLALISYLKLDAKAEAHRTSAYKFDALQSQLEFSSGKSMFVNFTYTDMVDLINETDEQVREIKNTNKFILPDSIRSQYPLLCNMNVFAEVKKVQYAEMQIVNELKDVLNEIEQWGAKKDKGQLMEHEIICLRELNTRKRDIITRIIDKKDDYLKIDKLFEMEMRANRCSC